MSARKELGRARKAAAQGRGDEALVLLWNLVEQARIEQDGRTLRAIGEIAADIAETDESSRSDAERLLETLSGARTPSRHEPPPSEPPPAARSEPGPADDLPADVWLPHDSEPTEASDPGPLVDPASGEPEEPGEEEPGPRSRGRARYIIPAVTLLVVLLNLLARAFGD